MEETKLERLSRRYGIRNEYIRCFLAELFGTFMLTLLIDGSVAQMVVTRKNDAVVKIVRGENGTTTTVGTFQRNEEGLNTFLQIQIAHLCALTFGIFISGGISGGHINPAVTLAMAIIGRLNWGKVPFYVSAQFLGAFLSAPIIYGVYYEPMKELGIGIIGIFGTRPHDSTTVGMAIGCSIIATFILVTGIMAVTDQRNLPASPGNVPFSVGLAAMASGISFGINGFALNPARDFAPRIFEAIMLGSPPFRKLGQVDFFFWIPGLVPFLGAIVAAGAYILLIELHHPVEYAVRDAEEMKNIVNSEFSTSSSRNPNDNNNQTKI